VRVILSSHPQDYESVTAALALADAAVKTVASPLVDYFGWL
jgi:hypothetical protein